MKLKSSLEQAEIFVFLAAFFLIIVGFNELQKPPEQPIVDKPQDQPPIILIPDAEEYKFTSGSAELNPGLKRYIRDELAQMIIENVNKYEIDVVEIIGHTDGQPVEATSGNLDKTLEKANMGLFPVEKLKPSSNVDLGLMRALAVARELRVTNTQVAQINLRAYSAGQLLLPNGQAAPTNPRPDRSRRRIEIRFTRLGKQVEVR